MLPDEHGVESSTGQNDVVLEGESRRGMVGAEVGFLRGSVSSLKGFNGRGRGGWAGWKKQGASSFPLTSAKWRMLRGKDLREKNFSYFRRRAGASTTKSANSDARTHALDSLKTQGRIAKEFAGQVYEKHESSSSDQVEKDTPPWVEDRRDFWVQ